MTTLLQILKPEKFKRATRHFVKFDCVNLSLIVRTLFCFCVWSYSDVSELQGFAE